MFGTYFLQILRRFEEGERSELENLGRPDHVELSRS